MSIHCEVIWNILMSSNFLNTLYKKFKMLNHSDVGISYSCQILLLYGAKTNKTLV